MSVAGPLLQVAKGELAFMQNGDNCDDIICQRVEDAMALDTEAAIALLEMINGETDVRVFAQGFEPLSQVGHVDACLPGAELAARVSAYFG